MANEAESSSLAFCKRAEIARCRGFSHCQVRGRSIAYGNSRPTQQRQLLLDGMRSVAFPQEQWQSGREMVVKTPY